MEKEKREALWKGKVRYKAEFLRSTGIYTGNIPRAKGIILEFIDLGQTTLALVEWDKPGIPTKVNLKNLEVVP